MSVGARLDSSSGGPYTAAFVLKLLAVLAVFGSGTSAALAVAMGRAKTPAQRRLVVSMHISSGVLLCVVSAMLAFWAFTEPTP